MKSCGEGIRLLNYEKQVLEYVLRGDRAGEEFFENRMRSLRSSVEERLGQLDRRQRTHEQILIEVNEERREAEQRLRLLPMSYSAERTTLMRQIDALKRESRTEMVRFQTDTAHWSRDARQLLEEYEGMGQLFQSFVVRRSDERGRDDP